MGTYRRLLAYVYPYRGRLTLSIVCGALVSGSTALAALLVKPVLDDIFVQRNMTRLYVLPLAVIALYVARGLFEYGNSYLMRSAGQRVLRDMREQLFAHLQAMPLGYFHQHHTGKLLAHVTNDIKSMENVVTGAVSDVIRQGLTMIALLGVAFYRDWLLASLAILVLPLAGLLMMRLGQRLRRLSGRAQEKMAQIHVLLEEAFSGIKIVKGFGREAYELSRLRRRNAEYYRETMRAVKVSEISSPLMEALAACGVAAVVFYGGRQVIAGTTTPGTFFSFMTAVLMLYEPMRKLGGVNNTVQRALAAADRVFAVLDTPNERADDLGKPALAPIKQCLALHDVSLRYQPDAPLVLRDISLEVAAGEVVAVVGVSGAGKTSLVHLIPRFFEPAHGCITIDGVDIRQVSLSSLRAQIGIVSQDIVLFDDTVRQNILYGNLEASAEQVLEAAQAAYAHDFIMALPRGYDTLIGERGVRLSGGEKQRLAIARALLRNPPILILDEATSSLDSASERMVQGALENLMKHRTTFVIAHRLSTVRHADMIVVLHAGSIVERGTHEALLARGGHYRRLYELQFKGQE